MRTLLLLAFLAILLIGCTAEPNRVPQNSTTLVATQMRAGAAAAERADVAKRCQQLKKLTIVYNDMAAAFDKIDTVEAIDEVEEELIELCSTVRSILRLSLTLPPLTKSQQARFNEACANGLSESVESALSRMANSAVHAFQCVPNVERWETIRSELRAVSADIKECIPRIPVAAYQGTG